MGRYRARHVIRLPYRLRLCLRQNNRSCCLPFNIAIAKGGKEHSLFAAFLIAMQTKVQHSIAFAYDVLEKTYRAFCFPCRTHHPPNEKVRIAQQAEARVNISSSRAPAISRTVRSDTA